MIAARINSDNVFGTLYATDRGQVQDRHLQPLATTPAIAGVTLGAGLFGAGVVIGVTIN